MTTRTTETARADPVVRPRDPGRMDPDTAHELKNALTAVKALVQLGSRNPAEAASHPRLALVEAELARMQELLQRCLAHGRPPAALRPARVELGPLVAGTLLRLKDVGADIHMWNLANGSCGTALLTKDEIVRLRAAEARASAEAAGATVHPALADDLAIMYEPGLLARVAAVLRDVKPHILLVPSPQDYMEDHMNTCRLAVTAAFAHGMRNFPTDPPRPAWDGHLALYHALPHGLCDGLGHLIRSERYVDTGPVLARKRAMLTKHETQKSWLDVSQGTVAKQPTWITGALNGLPVVRFDGTSDFLRFPRMGTIRTVFWVLRESETAGVGSRSLLGHNSWTFNGGTGTAANATTAEVPGALWGSNASTYVSGGQTRVNGLPVDGLKAPRPRTMAVVSLVTTAAVSADKFGPSSGSAAWSGDLAELIVYDQALSAADLTHFEN